MKTRALITALALAGLAAASPAGATGTATITVNATVTSKCSVSGTDTVSLTLDPSSSTDPATATGAGVTYFCSNKVTPGTVTLTSANNAGSGTSGLLKSTGTPADTIPYTQSFNTPLTAGQGFGTGKGQTATVKVSVTLANYQNAAAHSDYADTLTLSIDP